LQTEIAFAGLASEFVAVAVAAGWAQTSDYFIVYPATGALEIGSPDRNDTAKTFESVARHVKSSFYFDLCCVDCRKLTLKVSNVLLGLNCQFCGNFDKLISV
jgi:hypothetical protein